MNQQKLNELVEQAYIYQMTVYEDNGVRTYGEREQVFSKEKFAELIVKECIMQVLDYVHINGMKDGITYFADDKISEHFGVTE